MTLDEKNKCVNISDKSIERIRHLNAPKMYRILNKVYTFKNLSIWQSHVFSSELINVLSYERLVDWTHLVLGQIQLDCPSVNYEYLL